MFAIKIVLLIVVLDSSRLYPSRATCDVVNDRDTESDTFLGNAVLNATKELMLLVAGNAARAAVSTRALEWTRRALVNMETDMVLWFGEEYGQKKKRGGYKYNHVMLGALCRLVNICAIWHAGLGSPKQFNFPQFYRATSLGELYKFRTLLNV